MSDKYSVGDKVFNIGYLSHLGDSSKWLKMNMQPFSQVAGVYLDYFSPNFSNVKAAREAPMNHSYIFDQAHGNDIDRQRNRYLHTVHDKDQIEQAIDDKIKSVVKKQTSYNNAQIARMKKEIAELEQKNIDFENYCQASKLDIMDNLA